MLGQHAVWCTLQPHAVLTFKAVSAKQPNQFCQLACSVCCSKYSTTDVKVGDGEVHFVDQKSVLAKLS